MTWCRAGRTEKSVTAFRSKLRGGTDVVTFVVGSENVSLSLEDAASLGGYLLEQTQPKESTTDV